ncbi:E3 ubiquitin-protein ligase TRIM71-like [Amphiura filiformis]|uniref:E3 ubiquitin-protein ligase TRIM71-like n=1 Tax=Amphiura filiformis TaxID=82378 RepID=UPI003B21D97D
MLPKHKDQVLRWYCKTCDISICRDCTVMEHTRPEHNYVAIESATEGQLAEIKVLVENCKGLSYQIDEAITKTQQAKDNLKKTAVDAQKQLDDANDKAKKVFLKALKENYTANTNKLTEIQTKKCEQIDDATMSLQNLQSKLTNAMDVANQVMQTGSKHDVASNYSTLCKTLTQLQEVKPTGISKSFGVMKFKPNQKGSVESVNLGIVLASRSEKLVLEKDIGKEGPGKIKCGLGVVVDPNTSDIFIADWGDKNVKVFDSEGNYKRVLLGNLHEPRDVAVSSNGFHFITDQTAYVKVLTSYGNYLKQFPAISPDGQSSDTDGSQLYGLTIDSDGNLLVGNSDKYYISKHKQDGTHISTIQTYIRPCFVGTTSQGTIVVCADYPHTNAQIMDCTFNLLHTINTPKPLCPCGACCSDDGIIYISSYGDHGGVQGGIYSFTEDGEYLGCVTNDVNYAEGLALINDDRMVVVQWKGYPAKIFSYVE